MGIVEEKEKYLKQCLRGRISPATCAKKIGYNKKYFYVVLAKYRRDGAKSLVNGHKGLKYSVKKYPEEVKGIVRELFEELIKDGVPFTYNSFYYSLKYIKKLDVKKGWVYKQLKARGYRSPKCRAAVKEKKQHKPRAEREKEGELIQIDGSKHTWIKGQPPFCAHGAIDDATHSLKGLYFSVNESREGYFEMFHKMASEGVLPEAFYSDWSSCFVTVPKKADKMSAEEKKLFALEHKTDFLKAMEKLGIKSILALSPQAKGRIERMWQTMQANLPLFFRLTGVRTIEDANKKAEWIKSWWNSEFGIKARTPVKAYKKLDGSADYDSLFSVHAPVTTHKNGVFTYMEHDFMIEGLKVPGVRLDLQISYRSGFTVIYHGKRVRAKCVDDMNAETYGDKMTSTERDILSRVYGADTHSGFIELN